MATIIPISAHEAKTFLSLPLFGCSVPAGFASPADDYIEGTLDLNEHLIRHPAATFYCRASGHSMKELGILDGCLLIVDRAEARIHGAIVIAVINGELTCKVLDIHRQRLLSGNDEFSPIPIPDGADFHTEGVVIHAINTYVRAG
ncbi:LexA family transcriptional regulator [Oceanicoccus sp. KOV_DT_Chl]|uniref:LexA family protein n=1 Tax=Oceanicoccus sp. KOV_DT_Chl TaxID=1904639 RepID=UPI001F3400CA|nr:translesion error-prone DNA polymerase V autoproteolytic subunit [Oceanicoccus sp. KOV_DT_Chl]